MRYIRSCKKVVELGTDGGTKGPLNRSTDIVKVWGTPTIRSTNITGNDGNKMGERRTQRERGIRPILEDIHYDEHPDRSLFSSEKTCPFIYRCGQRT